MLYDQLKAHYGNDPQPPRRFSVDVGKTNAAALMAELMPLANSSMEGKLFWSTGKNNKARDVELTAYMVLNLVHQNKLSGTLVIFLRKDYIRK